MKNTSKHSKKAPRTRQHKGVLVSLCLIAAVVLAVGAGVFNQRTAGIQAEQEEGAATNLSSSVAQISYPEASQEETLETETTPGIGEYEKNAALVEVDSSTNIEALEAALASLGFAEAPSISNQDLDAGFVKVALDGSVSMADALDAFEAAGVQAQPNFIYHTLEDESTSAALSATGEGDETASTAAAEAATAAATETATETAIEAAIETTTETTNEEEASPRSTTLAAAIAASLQAQSADENSTITSQDYTGVSINDEHASMQWSLTSINAYKAWGIAKGKEDSATTPKVSVAVIDTGCKTAHADLVGNIQACYNSYLKEAGANNVQDENGHGTHVAGIVAADANNGIGVAGTSYDAGLVIIKASFTSEGANNVFTTQTLSQGYTWLMSKTSSGKTIAQTYNVRVVNMSLGGSGEIATDDALYANITKAKNAGILTVCAAGNSGTDTTVPYTCIPGSYSDCLSVLNLEHTNATAATANDASGAFNVSRSSSSNYNVSTNKVYNISAPGTSIYSTSAEATVDYQYKTGTSMAAPCVSGVAALLFAYDSNLSATEVETVLEATATDLGEEGWDRETGYGEVDAYHALQLLSAEVGTKAFPLYYTIDLSVVGADGQEADASEWTWESSDTSILSVDNSTQKATGKKAGTVTLTATNKLLGRTISAQVTVASLNLENVEIAEIANQTYTGSALTPAVSVSIGGTALQQGTDYTLEYSNNTNAGTATVTVKPGSAGGTGQKTATFTISPADISKASFDSIPQQTYTGSAITPAITAKFNGASLALGKDYTLSYENNIQPGTGTAKANVTGAGNFTGTKQLSFTIQGTVGGLQVSGIESSYTYTGSAIKPSPVVKEGQTTLVEGTDYTVSYGENTNAGTGTVTITGKNNYSGTLEKTFTINKVSMKDSSISIATIPSQAYTGAALEPTVTVLFNGKALIKGTDYKVSYANNTKVGTATVTVVGSNNFTGSTSKTFEIKGISLTGAKVTGVVAKTYNGLAQTQSAAKVELNGTVLTENTDYTVSYENNVNVGAATMVITGKGNYSGTIRQSFEIIAAKTASSISITVGNITNQTYTGKAIEPKPTVQYSGTTLTYGKDYTITYSNNTNVGTATAKFNFIGNYSGSTSKTFSIVKANLGSSASKVTVSGISSKTYNTKAQTQSISVALNGTTISTSNYSVEYANNTNAGTATITIKGKGNCEGSLAKTFTIAQKSLSSSDVSVSSIGTQKYTGSALKPGVTVTYAGTTLKSGTDYTVDYSNNAKVGTATATIKGKGNYSGQVSRSFTITEIKTISSSTVTFSAADMTKNVTGSALAPSITNVKYNKSTTLKEGTDYYLTYNNSTSKPTKAGSYTVRIVGKGNYSGTRDVGTFKLVQGPSVSSGTQVRIASVSNTSYVLDAAGATPKIGANISIWSDNGGNNQKWYLSLGSDGYYTIKSSANSNYVLDAAGASPSNGANISIWSSKSSNNRNQKWILEPSNGSYVIRNVANQNLVLDASGSTPKKGANVTAWKSNGGNNQKWKIVAVTTPSFNASKVYRITSASNSNYVLDAAGSSPKVGSNVSIWTSNNGKNQKWYLVPDGNGYYTIESYANKKFALDAAGNSPREGANVSVWSLKTSNNKNQKWKIEQLANGTYIIRSAANQNLVLDAAGSSPKRGANVSVWSSNGGNNQKWKITAV